MRNLHNNYSLIAICCPSDIKTHRQVPFFSFFITVSIPVPCRNTSTFQACGNLLHCFRRYLRISIESLEDGTFPLKDRCPHATCHRFYHSYIQSAELRRIWVMKRRMRIFCDELVWLLPSRSFWLQFLTPTTQSRRQKYGSRGTRT